MVSDKHTVTKSRDITLYDRYNNDEIVLAKTVESTSTVKTTQIPNGTRHNDFINGL